MLSCNIKDVDRQDYLSDRFATAYRWLKESDLDSMAPGSYELDGPDVVACVQEYETAPLSDLRFEAHDAFYDIQYVISGHERFGVAERSGLASAESLPEQDMNFFENPETFTEVILGPGDLVVVPPEQGHKPRGAVNDPEPVRKVVVKVRK